MNQVDRKRMIKRVTDRQSRRIGSVDRGRGPDAAWQFLQNLVLVGLIQPRSEELKRIILASPPTGPKAS